MSVAHTEEDIKRTCEVIGLVYTIALCKPQNGGYKIRGLFAFDDDAKLRINGQAYQIG